MNRIALKAVQVVTLLFLMAISAFAAENQPVVLFDQGHNQKFLVEKDEPLQLSKLAEKFKDAGFAVTTGSSPITPETLTNVHALVISGPFAALKPEEIEAITAFLERGGKMAVMLHISSPLSLLLDRLGVVVSGSVIHEQENIIKEVDVNFRVARFEASELVSGLDYLSIYGGWALLNSGAGTTVVASTGDKAWVDLNGDRKLTDKDAMQSFAVIVTGTAGAGKFVVFGDDAMFQNQYLDENNAKLAANLAAWMK